MNENGTIKILFKPLKFKNKFDYIKNNNNNIKLNNKDYIIMFNTNYIYNNLESCFPSKILNIKLCFFSFLQKEKNLDNNCISLDSIILYEYINNKYNLLNDSDEFEENINKENVIFYNFNENKINIRIEFFSNKIDYFYFNLSEMCSIYMLKYLIYLKSKNIEALNYYKTLTIESEENKKVNNDDLEIISNINKSYSYLIKIKEIEKVIKLYGNGIFNNNYQIYNNKNETNRNFANNTLLVNALNYYLSSSQKNIGNEKNNITNLNLYIKKSKEINININKDKISIFNKSSEYTLNFIMTEYKKDKLILGLDFRFNLLNYFSPYYIENDTKSEYLTKKKKFLNKSKIILYNGGGLKLFVYCLNQKCLYFSKFFVNHLGYGYFDLFNAMRNIYCPMCKKKGKKYIEIKYIGMMNAKWLYKGFLSGIKYSNVEGQGITMLNDIIYRTNEILFSHQFMSLCFLIEKYLTNNTIVKEEKQKKNCTTINSTHFTDNSYYSNISEEIEQKILNDDKKAKNDDNNEISKTIQTNKIKYKINRIQRKKLRNRNNNNNIYKIQNKNSFYTNDISTNSKCQFSDINICNNNSCWETCIKDNKNEEKCLIF